MKKIKSIFEFTSFIIILAFIFSLSFKFFNRSYSTISTINSAFAGAFFSFLFIRLAEGLTKMYERKVKHYNALVELELLLNKTFDTISRNIFICNDYLKTFKQTKEQRQVLINPGKFHLFVIKEQLLLNLYGMDLLNNLFSYNLDLERLNADFTTTNNFYDKLITRSMASNNVDEHLINNYLLNIQPIEIQLEVFKKFLNRLQDNTEELMARVRLLSQSKPFLTKIMFFFLSLNTKLKEDKIQKEKEKVKNEIQETIQKNQIEIEKILQDL